MPMPEPVQNRNKEKQSGYGILHKRTEMMNAGIPMPAAKENLFFTLHRAIE